METETVNVTSKNEEEISCIIVVVGDVVSGFQFFGPFSSSSFAREWVQDTSLADQPWSIASVEEPFM